MSGVDVVVRGDVNGVAADAIVVPVDAALACDRALAKAVFGACDATVGDSIERLRHVTLTGLAPGTILALPAVGHPHVAQLLVLVMFDNRDDGATHRLEPDDDRVAGAADVLAHQLKALGLKRVVVPAISGRVVDAGEAAATIVAACTAVLADVTLVFVDVDAVQRHNMGAAIESLGVDVVRQ